MLAGALAATAAVNAGLARAAERRNPPQGRFVVVDGVRLHYLERGSGEALVLLHGNGSMIQDFETSGLVALAARHHRVIVFDRPGFGHSQRPRRKIWTPSAQADLIHAALREIGACRVVVFGHSWGALVATELALRHSQAVEGLVLASGYYYPTPRVDMMLLGGPAAPGLGDVLRYTVSPLLARLLWPRLMRKLFGPAEVPAKFSGFPREMALRPSQLRAAAEESALLIPSVMGRRYDALEMPVAVVAGAQDRLVDSGAQSERLQRELKGGTLRRVEGAGHMVHQTDPEQVYAAIEEVTSRAWIYR